MIPRPIEIETVPWLNQNHLYYFIYSPNPNIFKEQGMPIIGTCLMNQSEMDFNKMGFIDKTSTTITAD